VGRKITQGESIWETATPSCFQTRHALNRYPCSQSASCMRAGLYRIGHDTDYPSSSVVARATNALPKPATRTSIHSFVGLVLHCVRPPHWRTAATSPLQGTICAISSCTDIPRSSRGSWHPPCPDRRPATRPTGGVHNKLARCCSQATPARIINSISFTGNIIAALTIKNARVVIDRAGSTPTPSHPDG
jgi:hypothetical protein